MRTFGCQILNVAPCQGKTLETLAVRWGGEFKLGRNKKGATLKRKHSFISEEFGVEEGEKAGLGFAVARRRPECLVLGKPR